MNEFQPLIDQLYREEVLRARRQTPGERMSAVLELSNLAYGKDDPELRRHLAMIRKIEDDKYYGSPQPRL